MSPAYLQILIHCYAVGAPITEHKENREAIEFFLNAGVIQREPVYVKGSGYMTTEKGNKWLEMILATPMPVQQWVDPRLRDESKPAHARVEGS